LTGMMAVGVPPQTREVQKAVHWLKSIQRGDGGWGESCRSDELKMYVPLPKSTPSQTAWAVDALVAVHDRPMESIHRGVRRLTNRWPEQDWALTYPTGAGLAGIFYVHYHSYRYIWPLLALSHYRQKFETK
jgi:sporulenol synthase